MEPMSFGETSETESGGKGSWAASPIPTSLGSWESAVSSPNVVRDCRYILDLENASGGRKCRTLFNFFY